MNDASCRWWADLPQDVLAAAAALVPNSTLVTIPAGHHVHTSRPQAFSDVVLDWLREL